MAGANGTVKAEYGPMQGLASALGRQASSLAADHGTAGQATGNPAMDAALGDLAHWLQACVGSLQTMASKSATHVTTVVRHFQQADS